MNDESVVLALDLGTTMGYALREDTQIHSGVWLFAPRRSEGKGMRFLRFAKNLEHLHDEHGEYGIDEVFYEEVVSHTRRDDKGFHFATQAAHVYGGFKAVLMGWCEVKGIPYTGVPVGTIKKYATGKGNAKKDVMIAMAKARGWDPDDDNEADALWLLDWAVNR